ncbi:DUF2895 family protein [bacterium]|nr:DUF2895 family protein [bacterium]
MSRRDDNTATYVTVVNSVAFALITCVAGLVFAVYGLVTTRDNFTITIPPNLSNGAVVDPDDFDLAFVEQFATRQMRDLFHWQNDGAVDYGANIDNLAPMMSTEFHESLIIDMNERVEKGEIQERTRYSIEIPDPDIEYRVQLLEKNTWFVPVAINIVERVGGMEIKNRPMMYPMIVRRYNSGQNNPYGVILDGYAEGMAPVVIGDDKLIEEFSEVSD